MIVYGGAGLGKTTLARALCHDMQCEPFELNASIDNSIETVRRKVMNFATTLSLTQSQKVIILDEADNMSVQMQKALHGVIETVSNNCRFIFTANFVDRILEPIQSRCTLVEFNIDGDKKFEELEGPEGNTKGMPSTLGWKLDGVKWCKAVPWDTVEGACKKGLYEFE